MKSSSIPFCTERDVHQYQNAKEIITWQAFTQMDMLIVRLMNKSVPRKTSMQSLASMPQSANLKKGEKNQGSHQT